MKEDYSIYTSLEDAKMEIHKRWNDVVLRAKVEEFLGDDITFLFKNGPRAITNQYVITPGHDTERFLQLAKEIKLEPLCLEFTKDKFVAKSIPKYLLGKLYFCDEFGLESFANVPYTKIINYNTEEGKRLCDVKTVWGQSLLDFHHDLTDMVMPDLVGNVYDFSDWFYRTRNLTEYYYLYFLSLFLCHGILFENYVVEGDEGNFVREILLPSFTKVEEIFGVKPLICQLTPSEVLDDLYWWCGAVSQKEIVKKYVKDRFDYELVIK
ncbi:MAG: hypothetical protein WC819_01880 [Parcubacteria group bacterium]|jgi:hypothetical protein